MKNSPLSKRTTTFLFSLITLLIYSNGFSQSYPYNSFPETYTSTTTVSKSCGSCGGAVSSDSKIGMRCPHCGVRWGYENTTTSTSKRKIEIPSSGVATTKKSANLRNGPSTNYNVILTMPAYSTVSIISSEGNWVKVSYDDYSGYYGSITRIGWVSASLLEF